MSGCTVITTSADVFLSLHMRHMPEAKTAFHPQKKKKKSSELLMIRPVRDTETHTVFSCVMAASLPLPLSL